MIEHLTEVLVSWARVIPLELFTFVGSFVEEVLAPIPSPIVMTVTGTIASAQDKALAYLLILSLIGTAGKTLGAILVYLISDKAEYLVFGTMGKFMGVTHEEVMKFGKRIKGTSKDFLLLLLLRALPIMSSSVVSIGSGVLKVPMRLYIPTTIIGTIVRDFFYLYVGYTGIETLNRLLHGFDSVESIIEAVIVVGVVVLFVWIYWRRKIRDRNTH